jgi:hypothetical protein
LAAEYEIFDIEIEPCRIAVYMHRGGDRQEALDIFGKQQFAVIYVKLHFVGISKL